MSILCKSNGFKHQLVIVPPFTINQGDWLVLRCLSRRSDSTETDICDVLTGRVVCPGMVLHSRAVAAIPFGKWANILFRDSTIHDLISRLSNENKEVLRKELDQRAFQMDSTPNDLPLTAKLMLELMLACSIGKLVVFNASGLDPNGVKSIYAMIAANLMNGLGAIEIDFPTTSPREPRPIEVKALDVLTEDRN